MLKCHHKHMQYFVFWHFQILLSLSYTHTHTHTHTLHSSPGDSFSDFFFLFFLMWTIFQVFTEFVTLLLLLFLFCFFGGQGGQEACGNLNSLTRDQTSTPCIGRWRLNHWNFPGKSPGYCYIQWCEGISCLVRADCCIFRNFLSSSLNTVIMKHLYHVNLQWHRLY